MDFILHGGFHDSHDDMWTIHSPHHGCPVCLGCIVEIIENVQLLPMQKKPALYEMLRLLTHQASDVLQLFIQEEKIVWHIMTVLIDNLQFEDESYLSLSVDTMLKLVQQVSSDDLVMVVLDNISDQVQTKKDHRKLLPHYTLLGKMLYQLPALAKKLLTSYVELLHELSMDLCNSGEAIQSALAYIFILLCEPVNENLLSPRLLHQLHCGTLNLLSTARTLSVQIDGLGLLKKLLASDESCGILMTFSNEGDSVLTALKKLLLNKSEVLQIGVGQIVSLLLGKPEVKNYSVAILESDMAEFLFEALHTQNVIQMECILKVLHQLSSADQFYKRCHAVYGFESVLRALTTAEEMKNPTLLILGYKLLAEILKRQPSDIPLFVSAGVVQRCLSVIKSGVTNHQIAIHYRAMEAFTAMLRKEHLLVPIPFSELKEIVNIISGKVWDQLRDCKRLTIHKKISNVDKMKDSDKGRDDLEKYLDMMLTACKLVVQCKGEPTWCESNFTAPGSDGDKQSTLDMFVGVVLLVADEICIPLIMIHWGYLKAVLVYQKALQLLCCLYDLEPMVTCDFMYKLIQSGFLCNVIDAKVTYSDLKLTKVCGEFLQKAMQCCQSKRLIPGEVCLDSVIKIESMNWCLPSLARAFLHEDVSVASIKGYLLVLYISYLHDNRILSPGELQNVLSSVLETRTSLEELPPLTRKHFCYLLAWTCVHDEIAMRTIIPNGVQNVAAVMCGPLEEWYSEDIIMLKWGFSDIVIASVSGKTLLDAYLAHTLLETLQQYFDDDVGHVDKEGRILLQLCDNVQFSHCLVTSLAKQSPDNVRKIVFLLETYLYYQSVTDSGEVINENTENQFLEESTPHPNKRHHPDIKDKVTEVLQDVFLKNFLKAAVMNLLSRKRTLTPELKEVCMLTILAAVTCVNTAHSQVCAMISQHEGVIGQLEHCIQSDTGTLYCVACDITAVLVQQTSLKGCQSLVTINLPGLVQKVLQYGGNLQTASLNLLTSLFGVNLTSMVLKTTGRITNNQYRTLYINLQQLIVKDVNRHEAALECMYKLLQYVNHIESKLGCELLSQPWNQVLLYVTLDLCTDASTVQLPLKLFCMFTEYEAGCELIMSSPDMLKHLLKSLERSKQAAIINDIPKKLKSKLLSQIIKTYNDQLTQLEAAQLEKSLTSDIPCMPNAVENPRQDDVMAILS